jgi:CubicO group peptidase (beta-lactamase class C family)
MADAPIHGACDARFARVRDTFASLFSDPAEVGGAVCITVDGRPVVDLWGGHADAARTRPWTRDTLVNVFSTSKGLTALCLHQLVDAGRIDLDAPVARYWPEFAQAGKGTLPVRQLLDHSAGLAAVEKTLPPAAMYDWDAMTGALAEQAPWWEPGTQHGYHALTFGWLVGELVRRVSGQTPGTYLRERIAGPLGADAFIGTPASQDARCAEVIPAPLPKPGEPNLIAELLKNVSAVGAKAFLNPFILPNAINTPEWRRAEIPAANGHASAVGLARIYGAAACGSLDGVDVLSIEGQKRAAEPHRDGPDAILMGMRTRFGAGYMLGTPDEPLGPNARPFGHSGAGGSLGYADPDTRLGFGYVMNQMHAGMYLIGPRANALIAATYECL